MIRPTTPTGSRVISTVMPGRTEGQQLAPLVRKGLAGEELEDLPGAGDLADGLGEGLALLAREQLADLVLAREDLGRGLSSTSARTWGDAAAQAGCASRAASTARATAWRSTRTAWPTTSERSEGLTSAMVSPSEIQDPAARLGSTDEEAM